MIGKKKKDKCRKASGKAGNGRTGMDQVTSAFFEQPMNLHLIAGLDGTILQVNCCWEQTLGYRPEELNGHNIEEFICPDDIAATREEMKNLAQGKSVFYFRNRYRHKEGGFRMLEWTASVSPQDGRIFAMAKDITAVMEQEERLIEANRELENSRRAALNMMEDALLDKEKLELTQFAVDQSGSEMFRINPDGTFAYVNEAACRNLGYSREELLGMKVQDVDPDAPAGEDWAELIGRLREKGSLTVESRHCAKDGRSYPTEVRLNYFRHGEREFVFAFVNDISERKKAESELRASEENLCITLDSIGDGVIATDIEGRVTRMNRVAEVLTGWSAGEASGKPLEAVFVIVSAENRQAAKNPVGEVLRSGKTVGLANHTVLISKKGVEFQIADSAAPICNEDGEVQGVVLVFRDVTEEYQLRSRLQLASEATGLGVWDLDVKSGRLNWNAMMYRIHGRNPEEEVTGYEDWKGVLHPEDRERAVSEVEAAFEQQIPFDTRFRIVRPDGEVAHVRARAKVFCDSAGKPVRMLGTNIDITDYVKRETERMELLSRRSRESEALLDLMASQPFRDSDVDGMIRLITGKIADMLQVEHAALWLFDEAEKNLQCRDRFSSSTGGHDAGATFSVEDFPGYFRALEEENQIVAPDAAEHPALAEWQKEYIEPRAVKSLLEVPVRMHGRIAGVLNVESTGARREWHEDEIRFLRETGALLMQSFVEARLREREKRMQTLFDRSADPSLVMDESGFLRCNQAAVESLGAESADQIAGHHPVEFSPEFQPDGRRSEEKGAELIRQAYSEGRARFEWQHKRIDGTEFPVEVMLTATEFGAEKLLYVVWCDISARKEAEKEVMRNQERMKSVIKLLQYKGMSRQEFLDHALSEAIQLTDSRIGYIYYYDEKTELFELNSWSKEVMQDCQVINPQTCYELSKTGIWGEAVRQRKPIILNDFKSPHPHRKGTPRGHVQLHKFMTVPIFDRGEIVAVVGVANKANDYTDNDVLQLTLLMESAFRVVERIQTESRIYHQAMHDSLTGLPNRLSLEQELHACLADREELMLFMFDLDRFKMVNDSFGHYVGDCLLQEVALRLKNAVRSGDKGRVPDLVGRLGGDEFVVLVRNASEVDALKYAGRIHEAINRPYEVEGHFIEISASIGITDIGDTAEQFVQFADIAMYEAKRRKSDSGSSALFTREMQERADDRYRMETDLKQALCLDQFYLEYQPFVSLQNGRITGAEALLRWRHPERGTVSPAEFIPIAEEFGLIVQIGQWVIREVCAQMGRWLAAIPDLADFGFHVSVNFSARQIADQEVIGIIEAALHENGLTPKMLELELTETAIMQDHEMASDLLERLKAIGVPVAIDDFGTGYSSLAYLHRFSISTVKIDRSFVSHLPSPESRAVIEAIVAMAQALKLKVVAEGVETMAQLEELCDLGCDIAQGFLCARPLSVEKLAAMIADPKQRLNDAAAKLV